MSRIAPVNENNASPAGVEVLQAVRKKMGRVPNLIATMAAAPAVANAYLGFSQSLAGGVLPARLREQIALAVGESNQCDYCVAAHTALGKGAGLSEEATLDARRGESSDPQEEAALRFAQKVVSERGRVSDDDVAGLREAGFDDGGVAEIVANVALNLFTNYFNHVADTEVDFPKACELSAA